MKKAKAVLDYHDDNFAIVFAAMGVRGAGPLPAVGGQPGLPWPLAWPELRGGTALLLELSESGPVWQERQEHD